MDFQMKDTSQIQVDSMTVYMAALGYNFKDKGWVTDSKALAHVSRISHRTAIALHNLTAEQWQIQPNKMFAPVLNGKVFEIAMNGYDLSKSQAIKLVQKVKMQPNRKSADGVMLQSHMVKPFQPYMAVTLGLE